MSDKEGGEEGLQDGGAYVSGFVVKLYQMVNNAPDNVVSWMPSGDAFRISDLDRLENETLPAFFRHQRFQSLVRQLNFYNFRKINRERTFWIYRHPLFHRDRPESLHLLRRRTCPGLDGRRTRHELSSDKFESTARSYDNGDHASLPDDFDSDGESSMSDEPPSKKLKSSGTTAPHKLKPNSRQLLPPPPVAAGIGIRNLDQSLSIDNRTLTPSDQILHQSRINVTPCIVSETDSPGHSTDDYFSGTQLSQLKSDQSNLLLKLSRKLEDHIKRATIAASANKFSRRGGKRRLGVITPPQSFHSDTMKYNALTYDDTDDDDNDDNNADKELHTTPAVCLSDLDDHACTTIDGSSYSSYRHDSVSVNSSDCYSISGSDDSLDLKDCRSKTLSKEIEINMKVKIHSWVDHGTFSTLTDRELFSAVISFCLSTVPADPHIRDKALDHMKFHNVLAQEFQRYKGALLGTDSNVLEKQLLSNQLFGSNSESMDTTRIFKVFIVNYLRNMIREPSIWQDVNFSHQESSFFQVNMRAWIAGVLSSA